MWPASKSEEIMESDSGFAKKRAAPLLTRENHETWFKLMRIHLESRQIGWVLEEIVKDTPATTPSGHSTSSQAGSLDESIRRASYRRHNATAMYEIYICLSQDDQEITQEIEHAKELWAWAEAKYKRRLQATGRSLLQQYTNFTMTEDQSIDDVWQELSSIARRAVAISPQFKEIKTEERKIQQLLAALPESFSAIRDGIDTRQDLRPEDILGILREKQESMTQETAMFAGRSRAGPITCHLCEGPHFIKDCPGFQTAKQAVKNTNKGDKPRKLSQRRQSPPRRRAASPSFDDLFKVMKELAKKFDGDRKKPPRHFKRAHASQEDSQPQSSQSNSESPSEDDEIDEVAHSTVEAKGKYPSSEWLLDSCASSHMTDQPSLFRTLVPLEKAKWIKVGGGFIKATHVGNAVMGGKSGRQIVLENVLFVPSLGVSLVSWNQFSKQFAVQPPSFTLRSMDGKPVVKTKIQGGVPFIQSLSSDLELRAHLAQEDEDVWEHAMVATEDQWELWHRRCAHLGKGLLRNLHKVTDMREPIPVPKETHQCKVCSLANMRNFKGAVTERKNERLALVSIDVCGPFDGAISRLGFKYWLEIVDNFSRKKWAIPLKQRQDAPKALQEWKIKAERQSKCLIGAVRSDGARELLAILKQWEKELGIQMHTTEAYNSLQNGVVERSIQTSEQTVRAMLQDSQMPVEFWPEALLAQIEVRNRLPNGPEIDGVRISPEEAFTGQVPSVNHLRVWGCKAVVHVDPRSQPQGMRRDKLMNRGKEVVFVGYCEDTTKQWQFWEPDMKAIRSHSHVAWFEDEKGGQLDLNFSPTNQPNQAPQRKPVGRPPKLLAQPVQDTPQSKPSQEPLFVHLPPPLEDIGEYKRYGDEVTPSENKEHENEEETTQGPGQTTQDDQPQGPPTQIIGKRSRGPEDEYDSEREAKHHRAFIAQMLGLDPSTNWVEEVMCWAQETLEEVGEYAFTAIGQDIALRQEVPVPKTYKAAVDDPKWGHMWKEAIQKELTALESNNTWTPVVPPRGANLVTSKWVFDVKRMISGAIEKLKARLVARGFSQKYGVDFEETFAPTVRHDTLRVFMAVVCQKDLELHQIDVNNAFTESNLLEDIYMIPPPGVEVPPNMVLKILRSLYGLKQAARDWNKLCVAKLEQIGFTQSQVDPCLLIHKERDIMVLTHVDDIPIAAHKLSNVQWFKTEFGRIFKIKDLGEPEKLLGMKITRNRAQGTIKLDQGHYIQTNLAKMSMTKEKASPTHSPMDSYEDLKPTAKMDERCDKQEYQSVNGTWMWPMTMTRPDLSFCMGRLSSYVADPTKQHRKAQKKLSRYLRSYPDLGLMFRRNGGRLQGYSDSDYAMDKLDRVSILGYVWFLCGSPVSWMSKKQKSVATSTMEAEYMAMCSAAKQSQFLAAVLREMNCPEMVGECSFQPTVKAAKDTVEELRPVKMKGDNQAALTLVKDAHIHERSKHIDVAYNYVRNLWWQRKIAVEYCHTKEMAADGLTKPLTGPQFQNFVKQLQLA